MAILKSSRNADYSALPQQGDMTIITDPPKLGNGLNAGTQQVYVDNATAQVWKGDTEKDIDKDDNDHRCGWGPFRPATCQRFRSIKWICFWLCWAGAIQGMVVNGFINVVISNIERRYDLSSTVSGTIASCYDIASVLCLIPVSYFGGFGCKPRYLGIGVFIMGIGSIVFSLPQFLTDLYKVDDTGVRTTCDIFANDTSICDSNTAPVSLSNYKYIFFLGQLLHGAGAAPLYTLGTTYIDDNVPQRSSSFYFGIFYAFTILGPAIGYLAGGAFLNFYVDIDRVDPDSVTLTADSPRWVGAWWIGFLISAGLAFLVALPIAGFPTALPGSEQYKAERGKEVYSKKGRVQDYQEPKQDVETVISYKQILKSVKVLVTNPTFMFLNLAGACEGNLLSGIATFMPKFIEAQFALSASTAAQYVGYAAIPAGGGGTFLGGYLVKKFDLRVRGIIKLCLALTIAVLFFALVFLMHCGNVPFAGVNVDYGSMIVNSTTELKGGNLDSSCNNNCHCSEEMYNPVCGVDELVYYNPCFAGCRTETVKDGQKMYSNCSCVMFERNSTVPAYEAIEGKCETSCAYLPMFMGVCAVLMLLTFTVTMPALSATLRCVPDTQRSLALGIQWIIARCLGSIPGPILFGKLIDITCKLWQSKCSEQGSCFIYDNHQMSNNMLAVILSGKFFSILFFFIALILYKMPKSEEDSDSNKTKEESPPPPPKDLALSPNCKSNQSVHTAVTMLSDSLPTTPATPNGINHTNWSKL